MTIAEYVLTLGIKPEDIRQTLGNMEQTILPNEYNSIDIKNISMSYFGKEQVIRVQPAIPWTDGTCRPAYGSLEYSANIYLHERIFPEGNKLFKI